jgi:DNA-binding MarR family transcriptional regulator
MTQRAKIDPSPARRAKRWDLVSENDGRGIEQLTIARLVETGEEHGAELPRDRLIDLACRIYDMRRARSHYFHNSLLGEPVWDMLLALFCLPAMRWEKLTVSRLSQAAGVPLTTGLRWSKLMEQKGLVERCPDPLDARRIYVTLSGQGEQLMCDYLSSVCHKVRDE